MDFINIVLLAVLVLLIFFMFRNSRKRRADQLALQQKMQPGVRIMTNFGLYGTLISVDETENIAVVEVLSGARIEVHRQTLARVVEPTVDEPSEAAESVETATSADASEQSEPQFGERRPDAE